MSTLFSLMIGAFLAATVLPFSSEVMLVAALKAGHFNKWLLVAVATFGNTMGTLVNWGVGRYLLRWSDRSWFPFSQRQLARASERFNRYGAWSLLFSWIPIIGDPLTFAAGVLKVRFALFLPLVTVGKSLRYIFIGWAF